MNYHILKYVPQLAGHPVYFRGFYCFFFFFLIKQQHAETNYCKFKTNSSNYKTHENNYSSATVLDLIVPNKTHSIIASDILPCHMTYHEFITVTINLRKAKRAPTVQTIRELRSYSPEIMCNLLYHESAGLNKVFATDNTETQVNIITECFNKYLNVCAPLVTREVKRPLAPWITHDLRAKMLKRNSTHTLLGNDIQYSSSSEI